VSELPETERLRREILEMFGLRDRAVSIAHSNIDRRLDAMNEFRAALDDQSKHFVDRKELDLRMIVLEERLTTLERYQNKVIGAVCIVAILVPLLLRMVFK